MSEFWNEIGDDSFKAQFVETVEQMFADVEVAENGDAIYTVAEMKVAATRAEVVVKEGEAVPAIYKKVRAKISRGGRKK